MGAGRKRLIDALLMVGLAILLLGVVEALVRVAGRVSVGTWGETRASAFHSGISGATLLYRRHAYLNVAPREGASVRAFGRQASFNSLGYRSPERPMQKPAGVIRVLCSGGSTTFDILAERDESSWPWLLEEELRRQGLPVEVWNAGFPGWTSLENLISLAIRDRDLEPDWIVLFQGINDLQPAAHQPFDRQYERGHADLAHRALGLELEPLAWHQRSLLLEKLRDALWGPRDPWQVLSDPATGAPRQTAIPAQATAVYERNLRSFAALAEANGARLLLVPQALRLRADHPEQDRALLGQWLAGLDPERVDNALEELNAVQRQLVADGLAMLHEPGLDTWPDDHWSDAMHFSSGGSQRFAASLAESLARSLAEEG